MKRNHIYSTISKLGPSEVSFVDDPLTYCLNNTLDQRFLHGSGAIQVNGQSSKPCQSYLSDYCAQGWDAFCETASKNQNISYPNNIDHHSPNSSLNGHNLTAGEILIRNTAAKKYLIKMANCVQKYEPFDPTVANSPLISYWVPDCNGDGSTTCIPMYKVNPKTIDSDVVMDKILSKPTIAINILVNIFNTMTKDGSIKELANTKLGKFFNDNSKYFKEKLYLQ
jgi:hypothetical protein